MKSAKTNTPESAPNDRLVIERVQTGVKIEKRILKVLKGVAEYHDISLGDLLEGIVLHAFDGKCPFGGESLTLIADLRKIYKLDLDSNDSHRLLEPENAHAKPAKMKINTRKKAR